MNVEPTILVVSAGDPDDRLCLALEQHGVYVERTRVDAFAGMFPLVAPDLVACLGAAEAPWVLREMQHAELARPAPLAVLCERGEEAGMRALHRQLVATVLTLDLPPAVLASHLAGIAQRLHDRSATATRTRAKVTQGSMVRQPLVVGFRRSDPPPAEPAPDPVLRSGVSGNAPVARGPAPNKLTTLKGLAHGTSRFGSPPPQARGPEISASGALGGFRPRPADRSRWLRGGKARRAVVADVLPGRARAIAEALTERGLDVLAVPLDPYRTDWAELQAHEPEVVLVDLPSVEGPAQVWLQLFQADRQLGRVRLVKLNLERVYDEVDEQVSLAALEPYIEELSSYRSEMPTIVADEDRPTLLLEEDERPTLHTDDSERLTLAQEEVESWGRRFAEFGEGVDEMPTVAQVDLTELHGPGTIPGPGAERRSPPPAPPKVQLSESVVFESAPYLQPAPASGAPLAPGTPVPYGAGSTSEEPVAVAFPPIYRPGLRVRGPRPITQPGSAPPPAVLEQGQPPRSPTLRLPSAFPQDRAAQFPAAEVPGWGAPQSVPTAPFGSVPPVPVAAPSGWGVAPPPSAPPPPPAAAPAVDVWSDVAAPLPSSNGALGSAPAPASPGASSFPPGSPSGRRSTRPTVPPTSPGIRASGLHRPSWPPELERPRGLSGWVRGLLALVPAMALSIFAVVRWAPEVLPPALREWKALRAPAVQPRPTEQPRALGQAPPPPREAVAPAPVPVSKDPWVVEETTTERCEQIAEPPSTVTGATIERGSEAWDRARRVLVLGDLKAAHRHLCEAVFNNPQSLALEGLAGFYLAQHSPAEALRWAEQARAVRTDSRKAGELKGDALSQLGRLDEARSAWLGALKIEPADQKTATLVSASYVTEADNALLSGDLPRAESMARRAAGFDPESASAAAVLGAVLLAEGFDENAALWAERCEKTGASEPSCLLLRGELLEHAGRMDEARELYQRITQIASGSKRAWQRLSRVSASRQP